MNPDSVEIAEPLRTVLRDYLHVEWYELDELKSDLRSPEWSAKHTAFKDQLRDAIAFPSLPLQAVERLTGQEFENEGQLREWLTGVFRELYDEVP